MDVMDEDSDPPLATTAPRPSTGTAPRPPAPREETREERTKRFEKREGRVGGLFLIVLAVYFGGRPVVNWVEEQFETAESIGAKAAECYAQVDHPPYRPKAECDKLAARYDVLRKREEAAQKREEAEKFCTDKGLKFKGTIGDQVECEP